MNSLQQLKLINFNTNQKATAKSIARSVSQLNNDLAAALSHQAYALLDPDLIIDESILDVMLGDLTELIAQFTEASNKAQDLIAVRNKAMTPEDVVAKYGIDLVSYSNDLA